MINFDKIENKIEIYSNQFREAQPYGHVVIDNFCNKNLLQEINKIPNPLKEKINKSKDYIFAKNKFEKSNFKTLSTGFEELYNDLISDRFKKILFKITNQEVFVDNDFHGGGLHQGGEKSFLDMHVDFNFHPLHKSWFRNLNILLYLNYGWEPHYKGQLDLKHKDKNFTKSIDPIFNRCVIMLTRNYTLHGYKTISFPKNEFRKSIAAYAYTYKTNTSYSERSTVWYPEKTNIFKKIIGKSWPKLVKLKNLFFGSSTKNNK